MKNIYNEFHFCCFIWVKFVPLFPCFTLNWCLNICLDQVKLSKKMTAGKRNDRKQPLWVVLRKSCFKKSEKPLKLVKKFRFPGKRKHHYCLDNLVSRACYLFVSIPFLSPSNIRLATCPGDEVGVSSISWNRSKLRFSTFVLAHPETFFFFLSFLLVN